MIERIDHAVAAMASTGAAAARYQQLGLRVSQPARHPPFGSESRMIYVGGSPAESFYLELFAIYDPERARASGRSVYLEHAARGGGLTRLMLKVTSMARVAEHLRQRGVDVAVEEVWRGERKMADLAILGALPDSAADLGLFETHTDAAAAFERRRAEGLLEHEFPLLRVDHLAAVTSDLEASTRFWVEGLAAATVQKEGAAARRLSVGDSVLELRVLGRGSASPGGLVSMVAWQVADLEAAVGLARARGFNPSPPCAGPLPGTRTATIPAGELAGVAMQLVEYR